MIIDISTPALLFPAVSLLFLSYTNRFIALSGLIRKLHTDWIQTPENCGSALLNQIKNIRKRLLLIRWMQVSGALSLLSCVLSMTVLLFGCQAMGTILFGLALVIMAISLCALVREASLAGGALRILLDATGKEVPGESKEAE